MRGWPAAEMYPARSSRAVAALIVVACLIVPALAAARTTVPADEDPSGARHWRLETPRGTVHVWIPACFDPATAGTVVYVHGFWTDADRAWREHRLAEQFATSGVNALFVVPEAPSGPDEAVAWTSLQELLRELRRQTGVAAPGRIVVVGHSGAYRSISRWLRHPRLRHVLLLDALYAEERTFRRWLRGAPNRRMTLVVAGSTERRAQRFVRGVRGGVRVGEVPEQLEDLPRRAAGARVLYLRSQFDHMGIVTDGAVIPVLLRRVGLPELPAPPAVGADREATVGSG